MRGAELTPVLPCKAHPVAVGERIPNCIVGYGLPVVRGEQILPARVAVGVVDCIQHSAQGAGGVRVRLLRRDVSAVVVGIHIGGVGILVVHARQLVQAVVFIALAQQQIPAHARDIPHRVVFIRPIIITVGQARHQRRGGISRAVYISVGGGDSTAHLPAGQAAQAVVGIAQVFIRISYNSHIVKAELPTKL